MRVILEELVVRTRKLGVHATLTGSGDGRWEYGMLWIGNTKNKYLIGSVNDGYVMIDPFSHSTGKVSDHFIQKRFDLADPTMFDQYDDHIRRVFNLKAG